MMDDKMLFVLIFSGVWGLIGVVFSVIGLALSHNRKKKEANCTSRTYGTIIDLVRHESHDSDHGYSTSWHPVVEYTVGTMRFIKESAFGRSRPQYGIGQTVGVFYNPQNYNEYYIEGEKLPKTLAVIFTAVGIFALVVAIAVAAVVLVVL